ncbi:hypothetical protein [Paenibacillus roseipurpureus]|uniref:Uncharacterized protein n=1 Tax=Paenibacillus roseopurpureus TaxID=2918901 RepID=A0AA96LNF4_9BACL|nr:hypothetical protein [Paenibacillus sp. MBLB1832]WNR44970.1 hypothetical protein MJB10_02115 [Paenibacillus sp. MBLB1832]
MSITPKKKVRMRVKKKVEITLRDRNATTKVYVEIQGSSKPREVMLEALNRLVNGMIYADEACTELIENDFIELRAKTSNHRSDREDFTFLIDRDFVENYVVSAKIIR